VRNRLRSWLGNEDDEEDAMQVDAAPAGRSPEEILAARGGIEALDAALHT
jgi:hypothetical protein